MMARKYSGIEIVSADSRQLYRGMDIGTAKPSREELAEVPHHMINVADPDVLLSAGWYAEVAMEIIEKILRRGGIPLVVGGSALYVMSLAGLVDELPARNDKLREALGTIEDEAPGTLHRILCTLDSIEASAIGSADRVRLLRSLEIAIQSGVQPSTLKTGGKPDPRFRFAVMETDNVELRRRIDKRTSEMFAAGLVHEVETLLAAGFGEEPVMSATIGYSEILAYLRGHCTLEEAQENVVTNTWKYARRQRNMFRRLPGAVNVPSNPDRLTEVLFKERISNG